MNNQKEKLKTSICKILDTMDKPLNQKLEIWSKLDDSTVKQLKEIESWLVKEIYAYLRAKFRKIQGF